MAQYRPKEINPAAVNWLAGEINQYVQQSASQIDDARLVWTIEDENGKKNGHVRQFKDDMIAKGYSARLLMSEEEVAEATTPEGPLEDLVEDEIEKAKAKELEQVEEKKTIMARWKRQAEKSKTMQEEKRRALEMTGTASGSAGEKRAELWDA